MLGFRNVSTIFTALALILPALLVGNTSRAAERTDLLDQPAAIEPAATRSLLLDVAQAGSRLVAVGERGHVLLSDDQGVSWRQAQSVPSRTMLTAVSFTDSQRGLAVGHDEIILRTLDGGETWTRARYAPDSQQPLLDVLFRDPLRAIAVGAYGAYFTTTDGGETWQSRKFEAAVLAPLPGAMERADDEFALDAEIPPDYHLNAIATSGTRLYIAAEGGQIYRSDDDGASWITLPSPYNGSFFGVLPLDGDELLIFGLRGHLFRSEDAGRIWRRVELPTTAMLTDAIRAGVGSIVLVGLSGTVLWSEDLGRNWTLRVQEDRKGFSAVAAPTPDSLVIVGENGPRRLPR